MPYLYGTNIGKGVVNVTGHSWLRANNTLAADTTVNVQDGVHLYLHNEVLTNDGVINLTGSQLLPHQLQFRCHPDRRRRGSAWAAAPGNKIRQDYGGSLVNDTFHTIRGGRRH